METSDSLRQKKIKFFCPILDTSTYIAAYILYQSSGKWCGCQEPAVHKGTRRHNHDDGTV